MRERKKLRIIYQKNTENLTKGNLNNNYQAFCYFNFEF